MGCRLGYDASVRDEESELRSVLIIAGWIWLGYLACLALVDAFIYLGRPLSPLAGYYVVNGIPAAVFLTLAAAPWSKRRASKIAPVEIALITLAPIVLTHILDLRLPEAPLSNLEGMVLRQLPVLFLGLVLASWHYSLRATLLYSLSTAGLELLTAGLLVRFDPAQQTSFYFVIVIRAIALGVAGLFINRLISMLRTQQTALEIANGRLAEQAAALEGLAISRERNRLARELHDTLAHTLSGLTVQLEATKAYWASQPATAWDLLLKSLATARAGLDETRRALRALRASPLEDLGLLLALRQLAENAAQRGHLDLDISLPDQAPQLTSDQEQCLYRVAQEALENVVRHAGARTVRLQLNRQNSGWTLLIEDDGLGTDLSQAETRGRFGLAGMRERARLIGGQMLLDSSPGSGMRVRMTLEGPP